MKDKSNIEALEFGSDTKLPEMPTKWPEPTKWVLVSATVTHSYLVELESNKPIESANTVVEHCGDMIYDILIPFNIDTEIVEHYKNTTDVNRIIKLHGNK